MTSVQVSDLGARIGRCLTFGEGIRLTPAEVAYLAECGAWGMIYKGAALAPQGPSLGSRKGDNIIEFARWRKAR